MDLTSIFSIAFALFLLMDPIGNIPLYVHALKKVSHRRQLWVILREMIIALGVIILFSFVGEGLMNFLNIAGETIQIAGGIILFLICLKMIFPPSHEVQDEGSLENEPFIVPLAVPLVAGPSVLAAVMIYTQQEPSEWVMVGSILLAWIASLLILLSAPLLQKILGWRGITAMERLMGLIVTLIAVQMFLTGISAFMGNCSSPKSSPPTQTELPAL